MQRMNERIHRGIKLIRLMPWSFANGLLHSTSRTEMGGQWSLRLFAWHLLDTAKQGKVPIESEGLTRARGQISICAWLS